MATLEEIAVVVIYLAAGLKPPIVPAGVDGYGTSNTTYRLSRAVFGTGKLGLLSLAAAGIQVMVPKHEGTVEEVNEVVGEAGVLARNNDV
jgi:hypothetical protein